MWDELLFGVGDLLGFWRWVLSRRYRRRKREEWKAEWETMGGRTQVVGEIAVATLVGLGVPILLALVLLWS